MSDMIRHDQKITKRKDGSLDVASVNSLPSMTDQQWADDCDINNILKKYAQTGELPVSRRQGIYADLSEFGDYQNMLESVLDAQTQFASLPAEVRQRFRNDPHELITFLRDPANRDEAIRLGMVDAKKAEFTEQKKAPTPPEPVPQPTSPVTSGT